MTLRYTTRPISDLTWLRPAAERKRSQFDSTWTRTLEQLSREIDHLGGRDVVIEVDVRERDIRIDGALRADARATSPATVVAFETKAHGPMLYRCDRYTDAWSKRPGWQDNVRAIALTLEALRAVDRYGATETGQQYAGFKALPSGTAMPAGQMSTAAAENLLWEVSGLGRDNPWSAQARWKKARAKAHPDRNGGDQTAWDQVEQAAKTLRLV